MLSTGHRGGSSWDYARSDLFVTFQELGTSCQVEPDLGGKVIHAPPVQRLDVRRRLLGQVESLRSGKR